MFQCLCRALTDSGEVVVFTPQDVPVKLYSSYFVLSRRHNTPLLRVETLTRVLDESGVGEGDVVEWQGDRWTVSYDKGFVFTSDEGVKVPASICSNYTLLETNPHTNVRITCRFEKWNFPILSFCGHVNGTALAAGCPKYIDPERIQVSTGYDNPGSKIFFGDIVDGGEVVLKDGCVCIRKPDGTYDPLQINYS